MKKIIVFAGYFEKGICVELEQLQGNDAEVIRKQFFSLAEENIMKPESIILREGMFNLNGTDRLVGFAEENGMLVRAHTLVWEQQNLCMGCCK